MIRWTFNTKCFAPETGDSTGVGAPATDSNTQNPATTTTDDVMSVLKHDPFPGGEAPKAVKDASAKADAKTSKDKAAKDAGAKAKTPDGQSEGPEPGTTAPAADPEKLAMKESLDHALSLLDAYKKSPGTSAPAADPKPGTAGAPKPGSGAAPAAAEGPSYDFNIPDQLVTALTSSDPAIFKQGIAGFAKGVALGVHREFSAHIEKMMPAILEKMVPQMIQSQMTQTNERQQIFNDFYGTYKELNNPKLYPLVAQTTMEVQRELRTDQWTQAVRDTVAKRVKEVIAAVGGAVPTKPLAPGTKHPVLGGGGNSRVAPETQTAIEKDIAETLFAGYN